MLSRIIFFGARVSLTIGFVAATLSATLGVTLGLTAGYFGGLIDRFIMRLSDIQIAFPFLVVAIAVIAVLGSNLIVLVALLSVAGWVFYARITRGLTLRLRRIEYVEAARAAGAGNRRIRRSTYSAKRPLPELGAFGLFPSRPSFSSRAA
ncbi:MAG: hypothetical protein KatS3mg060_3599 [Dehalococcoidia bacterium]|nr:MAG: hypothetical protein KatS3mg060_3599 [Dehalococcoidia bacterium]